MMRARTGYFTLAVAALLWACGGGEKGDEEARDLSLMPAESAAVLNDQPAQATQPRPQQPTTTPSTPAPRPKAPAPAQAAAPAEPEAAATPKARWLLPGTVIELAATDTVRSDRQKVGDKITATATAPIRNTNTNRVVIPAGAVFTATITQFDAGKGILMLDFNKVSFGGKTYDFQVSSDDVAAEKKTDAFKAGDAAKIGAGAVVGGVLGRVVGGNTKGAVIGGVAGAAAGTGIALATRGNDLILPKGGLIRIQLPRRMALR